MDWSSHWFSSVANLMGAPEDSFEHLTFDLTVHSTKTFPFFFKNLWGHTDETQIKHDILN